MRLRIGELREDNDITQKELADLLHVSQATYSKYENRKLGNPSNFSCGIGDILRHKRGLSAWTKLHFKVWQIYHMIADKSSKCKISLKCC